MSKPGVTLPPGSVRENPEACPSGIRHGGGAKLNQALVWNVRTYAAMRREKAQAAQTARPKVPKRRLGADCSVVASKRGNARGAKGAGHRHWRGSTGNGRNPMINGRRQPSRGDTSRMTRECQVRFCERLGVQFPGPTRQNPNGQSASASSGQAVAWAYGKEVPTCDITESGRMIVPA